MADWRYSIVWEDKLGNVRTWGEGEDDADISTLANLGDVLGITSLLYCRGALCVSTFDNSRMPKELDPKKMTITKPGCSVEGCRKPHKSFGLCDMHYKRQQRSVRDKLPPLPADHDDAVAHMLYEAVENENGCLISPRARQVVVGHNLISKRRLVFSVITGRTVAPIENLSMRCRETDCINHDHMYTPDPKRKARKVAKAKANGDWRLNLPPPFAPMQHERKPICQTSACWKHATIDGFCHICAARRRMLPPIDDAKEDVHDQE